MRVTANVYGVGKRKAGIGKKSGVQYDFVEIAIGFPHPDFSGEKSVTVCIDSTLIGDKIFGRGDKLDLVMHEANFKYYVDAIIDVLPG